MRLNVTEFVPPKSSVTTPSKSTWSPGWIVPARVWFGSPASWIARCVPAIWPATPVWAIGPKRSAVICSPV